MKHGKKYLAALEKYDVTKHYGVTEACQLVRIFTT